MTFSKLLVSLVVVCAWLTLSSTASAVYDPVLGRWMERDPMGTRPSVGLEYVNHGLVPDTVMQSPRIGSIAFRPKTQYADGMSLYQYVRSQPVINLDPSGLVVQSYRDLSNLIGGCQYPLPANSSDWRKQQKLLIVPEAILCLMWKESSFDTEARSNQGYYGLGQMGKEACDDVDQAYNLPPGTCWRNQQSNDPCAQIANTIAYLHHILVNKNDFGHDGTLKGGLKKYGPIDAPFDEYADPILECAECIKRQEQKDDKGAPRGVEWCTPEGAQSCFNKMNKDVENARKKRGL